VPNALTTQDDGKGIKCKTNYKGNIRKVHLPVDKGAITSNGAAWKRQHGMGVHLVAIQLRLGLALDITTILRAFQIDNFHAFLGHHRSIARGGILWPVGFANFGPHHIVGPLHNRQVPFSSPFPTAILSETKGRQRGIIRIAH